jgi:cytochrome c556
MNKIAIFGVLLIPVAVATAATPIAQRKEILKGFGDATKPVVAMTKGDAPFDSTTIEAALATYVEGTAKLPSLFPDDSKTGEETAALPKVWEDKPKFVSLFKKLGEDAAATKGKITDLASLKATFPKIMGDCKNCHDDFREKK